MTPLQDSVEQGGGGVLFSIIVPGFNCGGTLRRCIDSVLAQTFTNFELIFVNDGSTDDTHEVISSISSGTSGRVKYINQTNQGVSGARNSGIDSAKGSYLIFIDSDDWVECDYLEEVSVVVSTFRPDVVYLPHYFDDGTCHVLRDLDIPVGSQLSINSFVHLFAGGVIDNSPWNKVFRRDLLDRHGIRFPEGIVMGEDAVFVAKAGSVAQSSYVLRRAFYHYFNQPGSATNTPPTFEKFKSVSSAARIISSTFEKVSAGADLAMMRFMQCVAYVFAVDARSLLQSDEYRVFVESARSAKIMAAPSWKWRVYLLIFYFGNFKPVLVLAQKLFRVAKCVVNKKI